MDAIPIPAPLLAAQPAEEFYSFSLWAIGNLGVTESQDKDTDGGGKQQQRRRRGPVFKIECDHPRNGDMLFQTLTDCKLRSRIVSSRTVIDSKSGDERVPVDQARGLSLFPEMPGCRLEVFVLDGRVELEDPLYSDEELCARIRKAKAQQTGMNPKEEIKGFKPRTWDNLNEDQMKTFCREVAHMMRNKHVRVLEGEGPTLEQVDEMPGRYINNSGAQVQNYQPHYEDQMDDYVRQLHSVGG